MEGIISQVAGTAARLILPNLKHTPHKEDADQVLKHAAAFIRSTIAP